MTGNGQRWIDKETYDELVSAREKLCSYCENDACEHCIVTLLLDQAEIEVQHSGIIEPD